MTNENIYNAIIQSAKAVISYKDYLDEINVFPVKDGDTGSNLTVLMNKIILNARMGSDLNETLNSISNAALIGSRGNSGIIFSQFFYGLSQDTTDKEFDITHFIKQMESGYAAAYSSIENPVEGTIITLMRRWVEILKFESAKATNFNNILIKSSDHLKLSLADTKKELKILRKYNVVDSGALAFSIFIDAFVNNLADTTHAVIIEENAIVHDAMHETADGLDYRYCTELLIKTNLAQTAVTRQIKEYGDSLIVGKAGELLKIHMHTNNPAVVVNRVLNFATIIHSKVDDMYKQVRQKSREKSPICVITDSIADLPPEMVDDPHLTIFPIEINIDGTVFFDKLSINNPMIIDLINRAAHFPKTSSPSVMSVITLLNNTLQHFEKILIITVSAKMSSTYNVFKNAVEQVGNENIKLIDSKQNSISQGLIVWRAVNLLRTKPSFDHLNKQVAALGNRATILVHVDTLDNMVKGGRIKKALGFVAKLLHLKPIVSIDEHGSGVVISKTMGRNRNIQKIIKHLIKVHKKYGIEDYAITHVNNLKLAEQVKSQLINALNLTPRYVTSSSQVIALNAGNKSMAVGYIRKG